MSQNIYTYDSVNDQLVPISGGGGGEGGHVIKDESGTSMTQRSALQFDGLDVTDDSTNLATKVTARETNFVGTTAEWNALSTAEKAKYKTVDLTDDFNGDPIDSTPTANSPHAVSSGGVKAYVDEKVDSSSNFVGTLDEWNALTSAEKAQYKTMDFTDDFNGMPIDSTPTAGSTYPVQSGGVYNMQKVSTFEVSTSSWTEDTTSQSGTTLQKKAISLSHVYVTTPTISIGAASGYTLPTSAEQTAYNLIQYVTVDSTVPALYLYAKSVPEDTFYINVEGVD